MQAEVIHHVPGRVRLRIPELRDSGDLSTWIKGPVLTEMGIQSFRVNSWCASVVVTYDVSTPGVVDRLLAALQFFSLPAPADEESAAVVPVGVAIRRAAGRVMSFLRRSHNFLWSSIALAGSFLGGLSAIASAPLICVTAIPSLTRAWRVLRTERRLNVDFLDSLAILVSLGRGQFVTASFITWMISLGDWIRDKTAGHSKRIVSKLLDFETATAWVLREGKIIRVPATSIAEEETVVVYPGETIPVDGVVRSGRATVDQKSITGESLPVERAIGDEVFASTVLRNGKLSIRASRVGPATTAAQIVDLVESAPLGETRVQNYAEKFGDRLVAPLLTITTGLYAGTGNLDRLLSMLIVDFGTGIRVAAPTAVLASIAHAASQGILIKAGRQMERLAQVDTVVFDKTGTLTHGSPEIREIVSCDERAFPAQKILSLAAAAEARLKHPVSEALVARAVAEGIAIPERRDSSFEIGLGVEARINGYCVHVGSERFFTQKQIRVDTHARTAENNGCSTLLFAVDGVLKGVIPYADRIRQESSEVVSALRHAGTKHVMMITGDNQATADAVARQLGIEECYAETLPSSKADIVQALQRRGHVVAMVGDGINDSPALAFADVGIAMKHGADVARETADVVLMEDNLWKLLAAIEISRGAMRRISQNYAIIAGLNALALLLAIPTGLLSPNAAAVLSNGSAILASLNSIRPGSYSQHGG
jgi:heavy metal translocating P-type ATPase